MVNKKKLRIGLVGCGAIGSSLAAIIKKDFSGQAVLSGFFDADPDRSRALSMSIFKDRSRAAKDLKALISASDLVIEAASARDSLEITKAVLVAGKDAMVMSVGGLVKDLGMLAGLAARKGARVYLPSGAVCGIDGLKAANIEAVQEVTLTTRKNPAGFANVEFVKSRSIDLLSLKNETVLFEGSAADAVKHFPANINVSAVLSLAGMGASRTKVRIIAVPGLKRNIHEVSIRSQAGDLFTRTENVLHPDNPKTSYLAVLSAVSCLKQIFEPIRIGT